MKNKIIIPIIACVIVVIGIVGYFIWNNNNNKDDQASAIITMDFNSGIEIRLDENGLVKSVKTLNDNDKDIVSSDMNNSAWDETIEKIINNIINKEDSVRDNYGFVILHAEGDVDITELERVVRESFDKYDIHIDLMTINEITSADLELSKKYNITPAKASYINSIKEENTDIPVETIVNKSTVELKEVQFSGLYCDEGWTLRGSFCEKEIDRVAAKAGIVCPDGYIDYKGVCYEEKGTVETDKLICNNEFNLIDGTCIRTETRDSEPIYSCDQGELMKKGDLFTVGGIKNAEKYYCVDTSVGQKPVLRCKLNKNHLEINGRCYNGPAPLIGGGCPDGGLKRNGGCYTLDDEDQWQCPDGSIYMRSKEGIPEICPDTYKYTEPNIEGYTCPDGFEVKNTKCVKTETEDPQYERTCPTGYKMVENGRCINNNTIAKTDGYYCENEDYHLLGSMCILYDVIEAKSN